jgi:hypothetical protein
MTEQESPKSEDPRQISEQAEANLRQSEQTALQFQQQLIALQKISIELTKAKLWTNYAARRWKWGAIN